MDVRRPTGEELFEKYRNIAARSNVDMDHWADLPDTDQLMWVNLAEIVLVEDD